MSRGFFVTGTDTGVGKTVIASAMIKGLQARRVNACGMKPIETGCHRLGGSLYPADGMFLKNVARMDETINYITPYCYETPVAPLAASEIEGRAVHIDVIVEKFSGLLKRYNAVVVEGVGGILVPIMRDYFVIDLIKELKLPLVVVTRSSLGTLNHTLLTVNYALKEGLSVSGIIINFCRPPDNTVAEETNPHLFQRLSPVPIIGVFPHLNNLETETLERAAFKHLNIDAIVKEIEK